MNNLLKKVYAIMVLVMLLMSSMFSGVAYAAVSSFFTDIDDSFAKSDIENFAMRGIVVGYHDGSFSPNYAITRAEFLSVAMKSLGISVSGATTTLFSDVPSGGDGAWIVPYAARARELGIVYGQRVGGTLRFRPNDPITRAEALIILFRAANISVDTTVKTTDFQDVSTYAGGVLIPYVEKAQQLGIINGQVLQGVLKFRPSNSITRAESVTIISRASSL